MMNFIKNFRKDEDGAVTVDWVVLTAAVVGLAIAAYGSIQNGATTLTNNTSSFLGVQEVGNIGGAGGGEEEPVDPAPGG
ncbi:hypothetical protein [uncultured Roseobacter sp.]|uniref:Flp family type IVb pilin n=1 Tax=uncultured Roseobacter sp. TaxID=114847 RepID=UPI002611691E|nr:hypothetical protein [uncultured Roseobacter sp.]